MYLEFAMLQGCYVHGERMREALRPMTQEELESRQLAQAQQMRAMSDDEIAQRYGEGLRNQYSAYQEPDV
jgi:ribosomal protein L29